MSDCIQHGWRSTTGHCPTCGPIWQSMLGVGVSLGECSGCVALRAENAELKAEQSRYDAMRAAYMAKAQDEIAKLRARENERLRAENAPSDFDALMEHHRATEAENAALRAENERLRAELADLRAQLDYESKIV